MIRESIVITLNPNGAPHIAPIGVIVEPTGLVVAPFRPSSTLDNLLARKQAVVNYTDDVRIFAGCITGRRRDWPTRPAERIKGAVLEAALTHEEVELTEVRDHPERPRLLCRTVHAAISAPFHGFNRAQGSVIEAAILASRLSLLPREKIEREIAYLAIAIEKTAGPREREAWSWLKEMIEAYPGLPERVAGR
ncbi:MAG TPA: DUF447 domain-containing protein [Alphaproteobacteria bacterium]|nr:DUF447 domain-containing protein [Alphaproteobacteria bacterium]